MVQIKWDQWGSRIQLIMNKGNKDPIQLWTPKSYCTVLKAQWSLKMTKKVVQFITHVTIWCILHEPNWMFISLCQTCFFYQKCIECKKGGKNSPVNEVFTNPTFLNNKTAFQSKFIFSEKIGLENCYSLGHYTLVVGVFFCQIKSWNDSKEGIRPLAQLLS